MADVTIKADPEVLDQFAGITGLFPLTPSQPADPRLGAMQPPPDSASPLTPNWNPSAPTTLGTGAPDVGASPLPPIAPASAPASDMAPPSGPPGSVDYAQRKYAADVARPQPGTLGKIGGWAASILTPHIAAMIPQTPLGRIVQQNQDLSNLRGAESEQRAEETQRTEEELRGAQSEEAQARAAALRTPPAKETEKIGATVDTGEGVYQFNPQTGRYDIRVGSSTKGKEPTKETFQEQTFDEWKQTHPDGTRMQFEAEEKRQEQTPDRGAFTPTFDPKTGAITGAWNPATGEMRAAPNLGGATTAPGMAAQQKISEAQQKQNQPFQDILDKQQEAKEFADQKTGPGDIGLILAMVEATRPKSGFRMTQTEWNMIQKSRSTLGDIQALMNKVESGQLLTPDQRKQMLDVIDITAKMAQKRMQGTQDQGEKAPEGTRVKMSDGSYQVKRGGQWQPE